MLWALVFLCGFSAKRANPELVIQTSASTWRAYEGARMIDIDSTARLAVQSQRDSVLLWDLRLGKITHEIKLPSVRTLRMSPDGRLLAIHSDTRLVLYRTTDFTLLAELTGPMTTGMLAFSPNADYLAVATPERVFVVDNKLTVLASVAVERTARPFVGFIDAGATLVVREGDDAVVLRSRESLALQRRFVIAGTDRYGRVITCTDVAEKTRQVALGFDGRGPILSVLDLNNGKLRDLPTPAAAQGAHQPESVRRIAISANGREIHAAIDGAVYSLDASTGVPIVSFFEKSSGSPHDLALAQGSKLLLVAQSAHVSLVSATNASVLKRLRGYHARITGLVGKVGERSVVDTAGRIWDLSDGRLSFALPNEPEVVGMNVRGPYVWVERKGGSTEVWHGESGIYVGETVPNETRPPVGVREQKLSFPEWNRYAEIVDGKLEVHELRTGALLATFAAISSFDHVVMLPSGFCAATPGAYPGLAVRWNGDLYLYDQLAAWLNRPDLVRASLGCSSSSPILTPASQMLGQAVIPSAPRLLNTIPLLATEARVTLDVEHSRDSTELLIWHNEVPQPTLAANAKGKTSISLALVSGTNRIEVATRNRSGGTSSRTGIETLYDKPPNGKLYLAAFGVSEYQGSENDLALAAKDAADVVKHWRERASKAKMPVAELLLTNEQITRQTTAPLLSRFLSSTTPADTVVLFFAAHGTRTEDGAYYLILGDSSFDEPHKTGLAAEVLFDIVARTKALNRLVFIDACESGASDATPIPIARRLQAGVSVTNTRGLKRLNKQNQSGFSSSDITKRRDGISIIAAASATQPAVERLGDQNGLFTSALISVLDNGALDRNRDGQMQLSELVFDIYGHVLELSGGTQKPTLKSAMSDLDPVVR